MKRSQRIMAVLIALTLIAFTLVLATLGIMAINIDLDQASSLDTGGEGSDPTPPPYTLALTADLAKSFEDVITSLINAFKTMITGVVDLILSPLKAISSIFSGWSKTIGAEWYGPLLAVFIFGIIYILIRTFGLFDSLLDRLG
jgi:hypothetical protein